MAPAIFAAQSEQYSFLLAVMMYQSCPLESSRLQPAQRSASAVPKNLTADLHDIFLALMVARVLRNHSLFQSLFKFHPRACRVAIQLIGTYFTVRGLRQYKPIKAREVSPAAWLRAKNPVPVGLEGSTRREIMEAVRLTCHGWYGKRTQEEC